MNNKPLKPVLKAGSKYMLCLMILPLVGVTAMNKITRSNEQPPDDQKVKQAIKLLWSADDTVSKLGRKEILRIGSAAVEPLIELLSDLVQNQTPRFAAGKEEEGRKALDNHIELLRRAKEPIYDDEEFQTVVRLAINSRLISDAIFLLGELRAVEAIPVLTHIMERDIMSPRAGIEMDALCKIGAPAVQFLIKSIEKAEITAADFDPIFFGFSIEIDLGDSADEEPSDQLDDSELDDPDFQQEIKQDALTIKRNALEVLGEIGDKAALPFLENPAWIVDNQLLVYNISAAIRRIKNEPTTSIGPQPPQIFLCNSIRDSSVYGIAESQPEIDPADMRMLPATRINRATLERVADYGKNAEVISFEEGKSDEVE